MMRALLFILSFSAILSCQSSSEKRSKEDAKSAVALNPEVSEIITYLADSVSDCDVWLAQDYRIRRFFDESDTLADFISEHFSHDEILEIFQGMDDMTMMNLRDYLNDLSISNVSVIDSVRNCSSVINSIAFLDQNKRALVLFVKIEEDLVRTNSYILKKQKYSWRIVDTIRQNVHPRNTY